jgi:hypothetical protein
LPELRRIRFVGAGRDFFAVDFADERDPLAVGREDGVGIAAARSDRDRLSGFIRELDVALFDGNGLGEGGTTNREAIARKRSRFIC